VQRAAVALRFYQDRSYAEIGEALGCPEVTARSHVRRAVSAMRRRVEQEDGEDG
jgi:DNA-directed RNA polymerase specialized sigma24 family protein